MTIVEARFRRFGKFFYQPISEDRHREEGARRFWIDMLLLTALCLRRAQSFTHRVSVSTSRLPLSAFPFCEGARIDVNLAGEFLLCETA